MTKTKTENHKNTNTCKVVKRTNGDAVSSFPSLSFSIPKTMTNKKTNKKLWQKEKLTMTKTETNAQSSREKMAITCLTLQVYLSSIWNERQGTRQWKTQLKTEA